MDARKNEESFSQKLDSDSEIPSLHNRKKQQVTNFNIFTAFLSAALQLFQQPTQILEVTEFLGNRFVETISFVEPKLV